MSGKDWGDLMPDPLDELDINDVFDSWIVETTPKNLRDFGRRVAKRIRERSKASGKTAACECKSCERVARLENELDELRKSHAALVITCGNREAEITRLKSLVPSPGN